MVACSTGFLWLSDSKTMTDDAVRGMRRAYSADISIVDDGVDRILTALEEKDLLDDTWVIYTSDHGEMGGNHGLMSKCVLYEPAVRVPLIVRPPDGCPPRVVDALIEHIDVPATVREIAGAPELPVSDGRSLLGYLGGEDPLPRSVSVSENWGFASFETEHFRMVVDEDALVPCQLFDVLDDPGEDHDLLHDPNSKATVDQMMETIVRPFFRSPPARPHASPFTS